MRHFVCAFMLVFIWLFGQPSLADATTPAASTAASSSTDDSAMPIPVCPNGRFESGCTQAKVVRAISVTDASLRTISQTCLYKTRARCWVISSGTFASLERGGPVRWQHLSLMPVDGPVTQMMILLETRGPSPRIVVAEQVNGYFSPPDLVENKDQGIVFHIPGTFGGSGSGNADILVVRSDRWYNIDLETWFDEVNELLPTGFEIRQGVKFNFREMFASSAVWRPQDGNCCGTAGRLAIDFVVKDYRLRVRRLGFDQSTPTGNTLYIEAQGEK